MRRNVIRAPRDARPLTRAEKRTRRQAKRELVRARGALMSHLFACEVGLMASLSWSEVSERLQCLRSEYHGARRQFSAALGLTLEEIQ